MIRLLKNKKADFIGFNVVIHILEIIFIITVSVFVFFIVHVEKEINTFPAESEILFSRILYGNNGLWFHDEEIDRLYPGTLEFENFNNKEKIEESLEASISYGEKNARAAAQLIFEDADGTKSEPVYYNEQKYKEWIAWYQAGITAGAGARQGTTKEFNILIKKQEELIPGRLEVTILIPNR